MVILYSFSHTVVCTHGGMLTDRRRFNVGRLENTAPFALRIPTLLTLLLLLPVACAGGGDGTGGGGVAASFSLSFSLKAVLAALSSLSSPIRPLLPSSLLLPSLLLAATHHSSPI